jgi:hypothetical protein
VILDYDTALDGAARSATHSGDTHGMGRRDDSACGGIADGGLTAGLSSQSEGASDPPDLRPGLGGTSLGGVTFLDAALGSRFSLGGEVSLGADIKGSQARRSIDGITNLSTRHSDTVFSGVAKIKVAQASKAQVNAILGLGTSWRHTVRYGTFRSVVTPITSTPVEETLSNAVFATTVGLDTMLNISPRTSMLFTARLHLLNDDDRDQAALCNEASGRRSFALAVGP